MHRLQLAMVAVAALAAAAVAEGELCGGQGGGGPCDCARDVVKCFCSPTVQKLEVKQSSLGDLRNVKNFEVENCISFSLEDNAFDNAQNLQFVKVTNVRNATFKQNVFSEVQTIQVENVTLDLTKGVFDRVKRINSIFIKNTLIPSLKHGVLQNINDLQELHLNNVTIYEVEENAVSINLVKGGSKIEIMQTEIHHIQKHGFLIANFTNITMINSEIKKAESDSVFFSALESIVMKGNRFGSGVDVNAVKIKKIYKTEFSNNTVLNDDIWNTVDHGDKPETSPSFTLGKLVTLHKGNILACKCHSNSKNASEELMKNMCYGDCNKVTVQIFSENCIKKDHTMSAEDIIKNICKAIRPLQDNEREGKQYLQKDNTLQGNASPPTQGDAPKPTGKHEKSDAGKMLTYTLPVLVFCEIVMYILKQ